jgi:hypothetical protein
MKCLICNKDCISLGSHLLGHKMSAKEYYDIFLRKSNEGHCKICGKDTKFKTIKIGYIGKYCSPKCMYLDKDHYNTKAWQLTRQDKIKQFEKDNNCIFANDLRKQYGSGWYQRNFIHFIYMDSQTKFVPKDEIPLIIDYSNSHHKTRSKNEIDLVEFIKSFYNKEIKTSVTNILKNKRYELDIFLPDINLAIEFNGKRYHSIEMGKPKNRILNKSLQCRDKNIRLIHIYEFEDINIQKQLLKDLILGTDNYPKNDFNKNNLIDKIPEPEIIYKDGYTIYGAGKLY